MINSYQKGAQLLDKVSRYGYRPTCLLQACCGPCSTYPIQELNKYFDLTVYYNSLNIYSLEEYVLRYNQLEKYINEINKNSEHKIKLIKVPYNGEEYLKQIEIRKDDKEGGPRCHLCYFLRIKDGFKYASDHKFQFFTTTMTISRQKDEQIMNKIGVVLQKEFPYTQFIIHNFKKKGGQEIGLALTKQYNLYQQLFCGCKFSLK